MLHRLDTAGFYLCRRAVAADGAREPADRRRVADVHADVGDELEGHRGDHRRANSGVPLGVDVPVVRAWDSRERLRHTAMILTTQMSQVLRNGS